MKLGTLKGYVMAIASGLLLLAGVLLVVLQAGNHADFSLYGKNLSIRFQEGQQVGGVNTALLMIGSGIGGVAAVILVRVLISGVRTLRLGLSQQAQAQTASRLKKLADAQEGPKES